MDTQIINYITLIAFFVVIGFFAIVSLMAIYVFIRYGRTKSLTVATSLVFSALFLISAVTAFLTIQEIF
jgi:hypothetical protein